MGLATWIKRKAESIAKEFEQGKREYAASHPPTTVNARTETGTAATISAAGCLHPRTQSLSGFSRCTDCGSQNFGAGWTPAQASGKSGGAWTASPQHPTKEEWAEPAALPGTGTVFVTHGPNGPMFIERDADGEIIAQRAATGAERRNQHVAGLRGGK
jgi:hypothetical protein